MQIDTTTDEGKAALQKLIDTETDGLKAKNAELLGAQKKLKDDMKTFQDQIDEIKSAKEQAEAEAAEKSGDIEKIKENLQKAFDKERETLKGELDTTKSSLNSLMIDDGLAGALTKAGVAPQFLDDIRLALKAKHSPTITNVDGKPIAQIDGKNLTDFVAEWSQGDQGKHYIAAPNNGGGGANGANGGGKAPSGNMGGDKTERTAAIASKFPDLNKK